MQGATSSHVDGTPGPVLRRPLPLAFSCLSSGFVEEGRLASWLAQSYAPVTEIGTVTATAGCATSQCQRRPQIPAVTPFLKHTNQPPVASRHMGPFPGWKEQGFVLMGSHVLQAWVNFLHEGPPPAPHAGTESDSLTKGPRPWTHGPSRMPHYPAVASLGECQLALPKTWRGNAVL